MRLPSFTDLREGMQFFLLSIPAAPLCVAMGVLLGACSASLPPVAHSTTPNGPVTEHPGAECPDRSVRFECAQRHADGWHIYYPAGYANARLHEWDHAQGMTHGDWQCTPAECCAPITAGGQTVWRVGSRICTRRSRTVATLVDAPYYEQR